MKMLGSKTLETKRLILHKTEEKDLKELWSILCIDEVNKYYLTAKLNYDWEKEVKWQYKKLENASNPDVFTWTIELKDTNEVIGQISVQAREDEPEYIRDIGWFIEPTHHKKGYAYEAAVEVLKYMFLEVEIEKIITSSAIINPSSWGLMEKLGFEKVDKTIMIKYTFVEEEVENQVYELDKNMFLKELFRKEKLYIQEDIDKDPYMRHISDDLVLNITGESGSGKSTLTKQYKDDENCIVIDTDQVFGKHEADKYNQELKEYLNSKYETIDLIKDFDTFYKETLEYFKNSNKLIIIDSAQLRYLKDLSLLKGDLIVLRTCINTCYERCINRFKENKKEASYDEIAAFSSRKKGMYSWYHNLNKFLDKVDKID